MNTRSPGTIATLLLALFSSAAFGQCPVTTDAAVYPITPLSYPMTSNRYAVQYQVGSDGWTDGQVYVSDYGGTNSSPQLSFSGYSADTSMSFVSIPARASAQIQIRVRKLFSTPFGASDQPSVRPGVKKISVQVEGDGTLTVTTGTAADFAGEQFILWWNRSTEGGAIEGLAFFLNPSYERPTGGKVKVIAAAADLSGDLSSFDTLDFEGMVAIGGTGAKVLAVPANIHNIFLGPGTWVQGKLLFGPGSAGQTRRIYGPGVLDVSRFRYDRRACGRASAFPDDGLNALSSSSSPAILDRFQIDGIVITDHNHAATDLLFNSTLNNVKTLAWNGVNGGLRLGNNTSVSNTFVRACDDSFMVWGSSVSITNATVWQNYNGGVVNLGWFDNSPGDNCLIDGLYVVKTDWHAPTNPSFTVSTLNDQNNAVIASLMVPGTKFGSSQPPLFRNIYVEDPPQVLLSLKILPPDCDLITLGGTCSKVVDLTLPSVLNLSIDNLVTPPSIVGNSIGFQTFPSGYSANGETLPPGYTLMGSMDIRLNNVFVQSPGGTVTPLTGANAAVVGKLTTNGSGVHVEYSFETRRRAVRR